MIRSAFIVALAATASLAWEPTRMDGIDIVLEGASEIGLYAEWQQMRDVVRHPRTEIVCGVDEKIYGAHPRMRNVDAYFEAWLLVHPLVSYVLPRPYREIWQGGTIVFEFYVTRENASIGICGSW